MSTVDTCHNSRMGIHFVPMSTTISDALIDRLLQRLESGTIKRTDLVAKVRVSQSTFNRWKLRQAKPTGMARSSLERVLDALDRRDPISTPVRTKEPAPESVSDGSGTSNDTPEDPLSDW